MGCGPSKKDVRVVHEVKGNTKKLRSKNTTNDDNNNFTKKQFKVGDRVHVRGYVGTVRYVGSTELGDGEWVGIELDKPHKQGNDGFYKAAKYFSCKPKHGLFVRPEGVDLHTEELEIKSLSDLSPETVVKIQCQVRKILAKIRLRNLLKRSENEKLIDKHVKNTPSEAEQSINELSEYLTKPFESDRDKAFAIYRWLCFNVSYDVEGFFGRRIKASCEAGDVLVNKTSVCAGYANLYEALAKAAGLEINLISGYAKGYGYKAGQSVDGANHAWNALKIENQWYLSDATWGAGVLGNDLLFQRDPNTYRFLMQPDYAIYDYFPEDEKWQLLDKPVPRETFEKAAVVSGPLYEMGVELISHKESHYTIDSDAIEMDFYCPGRKIILMAKLKDSSGKAHDGQQSTIRQRTQLRRCGISQVRLHAQFPVKGDYTIDIFVNVEGTWTFGLTYYITANKGCGINVGGFPRLSNSFYDDGFDLITPLTNIETTSGRADIQFHCYNRRFWSLNGNVTGIDGSQKHLLKNQALSFSEKTNDGFILKVDTPAPGTYLLKIFSKSVEEGSPFVCEYYINNVESGKRPLAGFPYLSNPLYAWGLELVEPKENIITKDGKAAIKIKATEMCNLDVSSIKLIGNVFTQDGAKIDNLLPNQALCFAETTTNSLEMKVDTPGAGLYLLNIFGTSEKGKNVWLCNYFIYSAEKEKREAVGFPMLSDVFHTSGMKLVKPRENIYSKDGKAEISFECPENLTQVNGYIVKGKETIHGCCKTTSTDENKTIRNISIELPSKGLFKLNVFGKKDDGDSNDFLFCFVIFAEKGVEK